MPFLELKNVHKSYGAESDRTEVLRDINLSVEEGEFVAIVGYSGAGKTTFISMIAGLVAPDEGQVLLEGKPILSPGPDRAIVFQNYSLLPWMTVEQNVALAVDRVFAAEPAGSRAQRVTDALAMVNLSQAAGKKPSELSGGMRQRVSVARALSMDPRVLLLDEPLGALDALTRATIQDEIERIWAKDRKTVVLITNDVDEAILLADRIIPLSAGPAATLGPPVKVEIPRPRDRKAMNHDPQFKAIRQQVIEWLLGEGSPTRRTARRRLLARGRRPADRPTLNIGFLPLTDAAPLVCGVEREVFHKHGIDVHLQKFPSWDAITDALCEGKIDAAHMLSSIPVAIAAGLMGHRRAPLVVPWLMNRNGQGITLRSDLAAEVGDDPSRLKTAIDRLGGPPPAFASTHAFGTHALWLRYWLASGGIDPDQDVALSVSPPPLLIAGLRQGEFAGFCGGEPWNAKALADGVGYTAIATQDLWADHPEKALAVTERFAEEHADLLPPLLAALHEVSHWLDDPINREETANALARQPYLNLRPGEILPRLKGQYEFGDGRRRDLTINSLRFFANCANFPQPRYAVWFLTQFRRWGMAEAGIDYTEIAERVFRTDLYNAAARAAGFGQGTIEYTSERLSDGIVFDPSEPERYAAGFAIGRAGAASELALSGV